MILVAPKILLLLLLFTRLFSSGEILGVWQKLSKLMSLATFAVCGNFT